MQDSLEHVSRGGPVMGTVMVAIGVVGYAYQTAVRFFADAQMPAHAAAVSAAAGGWWDTAGQNVSAALVILGTVTTFAFSLYNRREDNRRDNERKDGDLARARMVQDGMAEVKVFLAKKMAEIEVRHAEVAAHLSRQDEALDAIKQAATPAPESTPTS
jgi:hypothetical protein